MIYLLKSIVGGTVLASFCRIRTLISNGIMITCKLLRSPGSKDLQMFKAVELIIIITLSLEIM